MVGSGLTHKYQTSAKKLTPGMISDEKNVFSIEKLIWRKDLK
jgi:hypothetical protein